MGHQRRWGLTGRVGGRRQRRATQASRKGAVEVVEARNTGIERSRVAEGAAAGTAGPGGRVGYWVVEVEMR
jgi:hypothetical protein